MKRELGALDLLEAQAEAWGLGLDDCRSVLLLTFARLLASYDRANVIGTRDLDRIVLGHVMDSLSCFLWAPLSRSETFADVGSGGGLPGIPIKIVRPEMGVTLLEATGKKARFLGEAVATLGLRSVTVAHGRVEDLARTNVHRRAYDAVTARAVARLPVLAEYCVPLLKVGGFSIAMKGHLTTDELAEGDRAVRMLGGRIAEVLPVPMLPEIEQKERNLVVFQKIGETPERYPRRPGLATKQPLGAE